MRIGLLTEAYLPVVSGVTRFVALHKKTLEETGQEPYVFTFGHGDSVAGEAGVIRSPAVPLSDSGYHLSFHLDRRARGILSTMDVLHTQHPFVMGRLAIRYGRRYGIPTVYTNHTRYDLYPHYYAPFISEALGRSFLEAYMPGFAARCEAVVAPTASLAELVRDFGVTTPIHVIPNGIDVQRFNRPARSRDRSELGIPAEAHVLIYVGRLAPEKRLAFVLRAFAAVLADLPSTYLLIVGDGPERDNLEDRVVESGLAGRAIFVGNVSYDDVPGYLAMANAFVTASTSEVHPLSILEAISAGLPVVGVDSPGVGDIIRDGENGLLSSDDVAAFSVRLYHLMTDGDLRQRLARQARADSQQYDIRATTGRIVELYKRAIETYRLRTRAN